MREFRIIAVATLVLFAFVVGAFLWTLSFPTPGHFDTSAAARIHMICDLKVQCFVRIGDLFAGDWDTFYEFGGGVSQTEMDRVLGSSPLHPQDGRRLVVLTRSGKILAKEYEGYGADVPLDGEVEFEDEHHREQHVIRYDRDTLLRVTAFPRAAGGTFYVLSEKQP